MSFLYKVVLITGGSSGIGAVTAKLFTKEGANVIIVARNEAKLTLVASECETIGVKPFILKADISKDEEACTIVDQTIKKYGKLDILVNNAGIIDPEGLLGGNILKSYDKVMNTNLRAVLHITSLATPHLIKTKGNIVNISSTLGSSVSTTMVTYCISKAGLNQFSKAAALDLAPFGVRVNIVSPGPVVTDILDNAGIPNQWEEWGKLTPLGKVAYPDEVAHVIMFLASDNAKSITGANYSIDNGVLLKS